MHKFLSWFGVIAFILFVVFMAALLMGPWADIALLIVKTDPIDPRGAESRLIPCRHGQVEVLVARSPGCRIDDSPEAFVLEFPGQGDRATVWRPIAVWLGVSGRSRCG